MIFQCRAQETTNHWVCWRKQFMYRRPCLLPLKLVGWWGHVNCSFIQLWVVERVKQLKTIERSTCIMDGREDLLETSNQIRLRTEMWEDKELATWPKTIKHLRTTVGHNLPCEHSCTVYGAVRRVRSRPPPNLQLLFCLRLQASTGCRVRSASSAEMAKYPKITSKMHCFTQKVPLLVDMSQLRFQSQSSP